MYLSEGLIRQKVKRLLSEGQKGYNQQTVPAFQKQLSTFLKTLLLNHALSHIYNEAKPQVFLLEILECNFVFFLIV